MAEQHRESFSLSKAVLGNEQKKVFFGSFESISHYCEWWRVRGVRTWADETHEWRICASENIYVDST
jgi:hypothetical protein